MKISDELARSVIKVVIIVIVLVSACVLGRVLVQILGGG